MTGYRAEGQAEVELYEARASVGVLAKVLDVGVDQQKEDRFGVNLSCEGVATLYVERENSIVSYEGRVSSVVDDPDQARDKLDQVVRELDPDAEWKRII